MTATDGCEGAQCGTPKFCKDCKHCSVNAPHTWAGALFGVRRTVYVDNAVCMRPDQNSDHADYLVSGIKRAQSRNRGLCSNQRLTILTCGPEGKYWEPK